MDHLQDILARLNGSAEVNRENHSPAPGSASSSNYQQPSVSSPIYTPSPSGLQPRHSSATISPNPPALHSSADFSNATSNRGTPDLLGLLKSRQNLQSSSSSAAQSAVLSRAAESSSSPSHPPESTADFIATWGRKPSQFGSVQSPSLVAPSQSRPELRGEATSSSGNPQDFLLKLLNQAKTDAPVLKKTEKATDPYQAPQPAVDSFPASSPAAGPVRSSPPRVFGQASEEATSFDLSAPKAQPFTYTNPFEQLTASSPLNRTPKPTSRAETPKIDAVKHGRELSKDDLSEIRPASKTRKISQAKSPNIFESSSPARESVSKAVGEVGERVEKQVEKALAQLSVVSESDAANNKQDLSGSDHTVTGKAKGDQVNENMDGPASNASSIYADWEEAADAKDPPKKASKFIKVFSLPMKPFVSIDIMPLEEKPVEIPEDKVVHVARMKKEFDQIDRNLVMCTPKFIAYALKAGGFRLIRQDSGKYKQLYSTFEERVFNLSGCTSKSGFGMRESETILGTGIKGTVFWAPLAYFGSERDVTIGAMNDGDRGFIFPPVPATDENTSGGQLKTRVKASSRTPDIFAYGRGKTIHIVWPIVARTSAYTNPETKICDSKKYLHDDQLKISTGKAAKDFAFSADDTVIASLDKSGKLKFWDIRALTKPEYNSEFRAGIVMDISTPIMVLNTNIPSEKSWPTSVMFVDKEKPMAKGLALRYMIVGMKQNHTVQLWDLGLGKPVQEINFPHDDESDAICSLAFHPRTGILAVGHPTRNSIYLLHVSPPKYTLSPMGQHKYMNMVVAKEKSLPVPNSTVIVSSIREYTMENRGQLRSLDLMHEAPNASMATDDGLNIHGDQLMTLIIMHSKGIFEFRLSREHLGWSSDGKTLNSSDALKSKAIVLGELRQPPLDNGSVNDDTGSIAASKGEAGSSVSVEHTPKTSKPDVAKATASAEKEKKKKKKAEDTAPPSPAPVSTSASALEEVRKVQRAAKPSFVPDQLPSRVVESTAPKTNGVAVTDEDIKRVTVAMSADFTRVLNEQFSILYNRISGDKRALEATAAAKQDAILRLVSKTLSENVESALGKIVMDGLATSIEPLKDVVSTTIDRTVTTVLANSMKSTIPREVEKLLPAVISKVLQDTNIHRSIADGVSKDISTSVNSSVTAAFGSIAPTIQAVAGSSAQQLAVEVERRISEQMRAAAAQHQKDSADIESLKHQVSTLTTAIHGMVEQQMKFQVDMRNLMQTSIQAQAQRAQPVHRRELSGGSHPLPNSNDRMVVTKRESPPPMVMNDDEIETATIRDLLTQSKYDEATIKWLHSHRQGELFDEVFVHLNPGYLRDTPPLVGLSVTAAVTFSLDTHLNERITWLEVALSLLDPVNPEYKSMLPRIMDVLATRLHLAYDHLVETHTQNPIVQRIGRVARHIQELKHASLAAFDD